MSTLPFTTHDVFTTKKFSGNPLAIITLPTPSPLSQSQKQNLAKEFNLSETVFLHPRTIAADGVPEWKLDIFTTDRELPFAGHPTIGTACHVLGSLKNEDPAGSRGVESVARKGRFVVKAGVINLDFIDGVAKASIPHATHIHHGHDLGGTTILDWQKGLRMHYPSPVELNPVLVSPVRGMNFSITQLRNLDELAVLNTPGSSIKATLDENWDVGPLFALFYVDFGMVEGVRKLRTRMIEGAFEDPATGSASCGLAVYLVMKEGLRDGRWGFEMTQGVEMGRESVIGVEVLVDGGSVVEVVISGKSVKVMEGAVSYD